MASIISFPFREPVADVEYKGFLIPKGWKAMPLFRNIDHRPELFPKPQKFNPSRFEVCRTEKSIREKKVMAMHGWIRLIIDIYIQALVSVAFFWHLFIYKVLSCDEIIICIQDILIFILKNE